VLLKDAAEQAGDEFAVGESRPRRLGGVPGDPPRRRALVLGAVAVEQQ
jgi:hypothetical protein